MSTQTEKPKKGRKSAPVSAGIETAVHKATETVEEEKIVGPLAILAQNKGLQPKAAKETAANIAPNVDTLDEETIIDDLKEADQIAASYVEKVKPKNLVVIKKLNRSAFRLGLELTDDKYGLVPGGATIWEPAFIGDHCKTGLTDKPEVRARLEAALGRDLSPTSEFWKTLRYRIEDKKHGQIMNFDDPTKGPRDEVVYFAMLESPIVANGFHEYNSGKKPDAEWYIENREAEALAEASSIERELRAAEVFKNASDGVVRMIGKLEGLNVYGASPMVVRTMVYKWMKQSSMNADKLLRYVEDTDVSRLIVGSLVKDAVKFNVIRRARNRDYIYGQEILGSTEEQVVSKLLLPSNTSMRMAIEDKVKVYLG